jgi:hypothetical protein
LQVYFNVALFGSKRVLLQILFRRFEVELWRVFTMAWRRTEVLVVLLLSLIQVCESLCYQERKKAFAQNISACVVSACAAVLWWGSQLTHNAHMHCALFEASACLLPATIFVNLSFKVFHKRRLVFRSPLMSQGKFSIVFLSKFKIKNFVLMFQFLSKFFLVISVLRWPCLERLSFLTYWIEEAIEKGLKRFVDKQ